MSNIQLFLLGVMVALTPSMIVVAILLWRAPSIDQGELRPTRQRQQP
jgi:hypothetical protein